MPEGPEIRRAADQIDRALRGQVATRVWFAFPKLRRKASALRGARVLRVEPRPSQVAITVADTGCGIAEEDLPQIFDRYFRRDTVPRDDVASTGLGLAIVKRILDLHGSRISVTSRVDVGTRFEFTLPTAA